MMALFTLTVATPPTNAAEPASGASEKKPFTAHDLVTLDRVSDPRVSPDGRFVAYGLRTTDLEANKAAHSVWLLDLQTPGTVPRPLTASGSNAPVARSLTRTRYTSEPWVSSA